MNRFFGKKKNEAPEPSLDYTASMMEGRSTQVEAKVRKLEQELFGYKQALAAAKTPAAKQLIKQKAMRVLKQKQLYSKQLETMQNQQFNVDQTRMAQQGMQDSIQMVAAMKVANKQLKKQFKEVDLDEVEDLHDDMSELMEDAAAMNEILGQTFGVPDDIDEDDLNAELDALDEEMLQEETAPDYLTAAMLPTAQTPQSEKTSAIHKHIIMLICPL
uniref:Charged multivesicular body protein 5 n=1 Tax=Spongospora subterranea TaxID=70186 RepID=A0A0H5R8U5_9EUKA|eukprot:CRZ04779.1 hypothetical protein [Spongospora subterranea]